MKLQINKIYEHLAKECTTGNDEEVDYFTNNSMNYFELQ